MEILILKLFMILFSITYVVDHSGIIYEISKKLYTKLNPNKPYSGQIIPKPFSCSLCLSFWITIGYMLINFPTYGIIVAIFIGVTSTFVTKVFNKIIQKIIQIIY
jgi:hypothetical protein